MDKKILMQKAYNWIAEQDENAAIISDGDIDIASEFIAEFIQNLIDNGVLAEHSDESAVLPIHGVRLSLPFNDLYKELDDKRMPPHIDSEGVWHLYKKQTAEHLLDNYDIYHKGERQ